jgi:ATP-dependent DNA ligase
LTGGYLLSSQCNGYPHHPYGDIQYVEHAEGQGGKLFEAVCKLCLEGIVSKKLDAPYRSGPSKTWIKVKNPKAPAATRTIDGTF